MFIKVAAKLMACFALASLLSWVSAAQQTPPPNSEPSAQAQVPAQTQPSSSAAPSPSQSGKDAPDKKGQASGTSNDRLFYALPNFLSLESTDKAPPLTTKQKFSVVTRGAFDYIQIPWYGFLSSLSQAQDGEEGFGQGAAGYGKRFATAVADGTIENFMTGAILPSLLHQDPRFFQSGKGGFTRRTGYAVSRIFVTRTDSGNSQFNYSEILGSALSASISTYSYHPKSKYVSTPSNPHLFIPSDRTLKNTASVWGTQVAYDTLTIAVKEFWPDIHRKLSQKHKDDPAASEGSNP